MFENSSPSAILFTAMIAVAATSALAAEVAPSLDPKCDKPEYPRASLMNEEAGTVTVALLVGADGNVVESKLEKSSGFKNLDKATLNGFAKCRFKPGTKDGKAEQAWTKVQYVWKLD